MTSRWRVQIQPQAVDDLEAIHAWISRDSVTRASRMIERIFRTIEGLGILPHHFVYQHKSKRLNSAVRSLTVRPYTIYFRIDEIK